MRLLPFLLLALLCSPPRLSQAQPQKAYVGMYLMNLYDLNMDEHSFYADFYIWFKWKGSIDPTNFEFVNSIEKWSTMSVMAGDSTHLIMRDSSNYRIFRVEGRFFHSFLLGRFPLDEHALDIQIESPEHAADSLVYLPDTNSVSIRNTLNMVGWNIRGARLESKLHDYGTAFGNPEENARQYSNLSYTITLARPLSYFLLKMLLPILVVMLISIGALLAHPSYVDTRSSLPIGGLLTAVFLQQTYSNALPDTGYMVLMDKIYLLSYVIISLVLLQIILAGNWLLRKKAVPEKKIIQLERRLAIAYGLLFIVGVVVLCGAG